MLQHAEPAAQAVEEAGHGASGTFDAGTTIIGHVANSPVDHPLIHLPTIAGIDMSVTKHVLMLWVTAAFLLIVTTFAVRRYARRGDMVPRPGRAARAAMREAAVTSSLNLTITLPGR